MKFHEILQEASKRVARNRFAPKVRCSICFGSGEVRGYPTFNRMGTGEIFKQPCQVCGGSGEKPEW